MKKMNACSLSLLLSLLSVFILTPSIVSAASLDVRHTPPEEALVDKPLTLEFEIISKRLKIDYALVYHRNLMTSSYKTSFLKKKEGNTWQAVIGYKDVSHPGIEYYAVLYNTKGKEYVIFAEKDLPQMVKVVDTKSKPAPVAAVVQKKKLAPEPEIDSAFEGISVEPERIQQEESPPQDQDEEFAKEDSDEELEEEFALFTAETEAKVTSATKTEQDISHSPMSITVLTSEDLHNYGSPSFVDALRTVPGLEFMQISPADKNITLRGFNREGSNKMLTLIDGRSVYVDLFGITFWESLPVPLDEIDRIEVIRGPGSVLYGTNAFSGAINIFTKKPEDIKGFLYSVHTGMNGTTASAVTGDRVENLGYKISGGYHQLSSFEDYSADASESVYLNAYIDYSIAKDFSFSLSGGASKTDAASIFSLVGPVAPEATQTYTKLNAEWKGLKGQVYWSYINLDADFKFPIPENIVADPVWFDPNHQNQGDNWELWREQNVLQLGIDMPSTQAIHSTGHTADLELSYNHEFAGLDRIYAGGNLRIVTLDSPNLVDKSSQTNNVSLFLQNDLYPWDWFHFNAGIRWDMLNVQEPGVSDIHNLAPRGALMFFPTKDHAIRLSGGAAFRNPAYFESHMKMRLADMNVNASTSNLDSLIQLPDVSKETDLVFQGNPGLDPEKIYSAELGYSGRFAKRVELNVDVYYNMLRDLILFNGDTDKMYWALNPFSPDDWLDNDDNNPFNFNNNVDASSIGFEVAVNYHATSWLKLFANYSFQKIWVDNEQELIDNYVDDKNEFYSRLPQSANFEVAGAQIPNELFDEDPSEIFKIDSGDVDLDDITTVDKENPEHKANLGVNTSYKGFSFNLFGHFVSKTQRKNFMTNLAHAEFLTFSYDKDRVGGWVRYEGSGPVAVYTKESTSDTSTRTTIYGLTKISEYVILNANVSYKFWDGKMEIGLAMFDLLQFTSLWKDISNNGFLLNKKSYDSNGTSIPYRTARGTSSRYIQYPRQMLFGEVSGGQAIPTRAYLFVRGKI